MSLSCACPDWEGDGWYYFGPDDYTCLDTKRSRKCCSCGERIAVGELCGKFLRECNPEEDSIAQRIHGDEMSLAPWWMCERCTDLYFSLEELGFCITLSDDMRQLVREYAEMNKG